MKCRFNCGDNMELYERIDGVEYWRCLDCLRLTTCDETFLVKGHRFTRETFKELF
jgi:hypothetical protein